MGNRLSNICIDIKNGNGKCGGNGHNITVNKGISKDCNTFIEHTFEICKGDQCTKLYNVILKEGTDKHLFGYYPSYDHEMLTKVAVYYSVLKPKEPLVVSLTTKQPRTFNCYYKLLKDYKWDYSYYISWYAGSGPLKDQLVEVYKSKTRDRKITFKSGTGTKTGNIDCNNFEINDSKTSNGKFKRRVYTPMIDKNPPFNMFDGTLFDDLKPIGGTNGDTEGRTNTFDTTCLTSYNIVGYHFDGIIVHYTDTGNSPENVALLVEFINDCTRIQFKRKDMYGYWWENTNVDYENVEDKLAEKLKGIKNESEGNKVVRYMLDQKKTYNNVQVTSDPGNPPKVPAAPVNPAKHDGYAKYTHAPDNAKANGAQTSKFYLHCKEVTGVGDKKIISDKDKVEVYFIVRKDKRTPEDDMPFLLAFTVKNGASNGTTTYYSRKDTDSPWKDITEDLKENGRVMLQERLTKISKLASCSEEAFVILRPAAYAILKGEKDPVVTPPSPPKVPELIEHIKTPPILTTEQIIGIAVGSVVGGFVITGGTYGLYWYYTTIWLLT